MSALLAMTLLAAPVAADWAKAAELSASASTWSVDAEKLAAHPVDAREVSALLARLMGDCLAGEVRCREPLGKPAEHDDDLDRLTNVLGEIGSHRDLALLDRLSARGLYNAGRAADRILEREWQAGLEALRPKCGPPSDDAVKRQAEQLTGLTTAERVDLAYFFESIDRNATAVGENAPETSHWPKQNDGSPALDALAAQLETIRFQGDAAATAKKAREYLGLLGYPGPITGRDAFGWHGARYSNVMRELADALERLGEHGEAALLQRLANPSGGMCGTGASARWADQVRAVLRNTERAGGCATAERLLEIDAFSESYGTSELVRRGFDLKRLYRGALLDQAWERRVRALEATVALSGPEGLGAAVSAIEHARADAAVRGLEALGKRVRHPDDDLCDESDLLRGFGISISSEWSRPVKPLGEACATRLSTAEEDALAVRLSRLESSPDPRVRLALAGVLRDLASKKGSATLLRLGDCTGDEDWVCSELRKTAEEGAQRIREAKFFGPRPAK